MVEILLGLVLLILIINSALIFRKQSDREVTNLLTELKIFLQNLDKNIDKIEASLRDEFSKNREEQTKTLSSFSNNLATNMTSIAQLQKNQLDTFSSRLNELTQVFLTQLKDFNSQFVNSSRESREELGKNLEKIQNTLENQLKSLRDENAKKLDEMRNVVDEKLQTTLEKRLSESFKIVSERLEMVYKGLGEMQNLAVSVGDLKKVLSNVKTRGILGEIQLGNILEQILTPDQYEREVKTKKNSSEKVEFAIKLPGKGDENPVVYLPIDSKFPMDIYHKLIESYDAGDNQKTEKAIKDLENSIKGFAKDIRDKYIDPPYTTDFAIMFLPTEGLYAEVVKRTSLIEILQSEYKIIISGPTTLSAFLNSLQMGFKTLAIEKRASEVWEILGAVKTEFNKFGEVLEKAKEKIDKASEDIEKLVGTRTKAIQAKLKRVEEISYDKAKSILFENQEE
ncbi:MAG: DNA recombination protein RmuC [Proteobacteria bacterium]|nr:DNA recombination protein RmuC [Pseudomonadota bacterium]